MVGPVPAREEETARLSGARGDFVSGLGRRVEALRASLRAVEQAPSDVAQKNGLLRRVHALASAARVLGFASVAEALTEAEKRLRRSEFAEVARALDLLPSLVLGVPLSLRPPADIAGERAPHPWPLSVLIFGAQSLADAIQAIPGTHVECERTEDLARAREQARLFGPDLAIIDADRAGARDLVETFAKDPSVEPVPLVVVGDFASPDAASAFISLGAARVLSKPVSPDALQRTVVELRAQAAESRTGREPLGELSVEALADRISVEVRRGLLEAVEPGARGIAVGFGDGADVMAAVWGAVARVRELVTLRSSGAVRFESTGPEGSVPLAAWGNEERRAGERGSSPPGARADNVSLQGRRIVVADDDPAVVWFMSGLLKAMGVEVLEAHDGARALALTYDAWPDLVVSDVLMPRLDGFSLCHEIKRDVAVRDVPVVLLSWKEDLLQRVRELGASADGYLRKEAAAATVAERLREVLRPRARVEQRLAAGGDARGRLDGLTPRLILELACAGGRDLRVGIRDAVYLYEVQVRRGQLGSATRTSAEGHFERGEPVLGALLGVSAGRFVIEPDSSPFRSDFAGKPADVLKQPIARARRALNSISANALVGVTRVHVDGASLQGYLACTPEPARGLLQKIIDGASPRDLITSGESAPRLLEAVLSDAARRGAITEIERVGNEPAPPRGSDPTEIGARSASMLAASPLRGAPANLPIATKPPETGAEDAGWFSFQLESAAPAPVVPKEESLPAPKVDSASPGPELAALAPRTADASIAAENPIADQPPIPEDKKLPFNSEVTPSADGLWETLTGGARPEGTLQGVGGLPDVGAAPPPERVSAAGDTPKTGEKEAAFDPNAEAEDALASVLTEDSPEEAMFEHPIGATQVMSAISLPDSRKVDDPDPIEMTQAVDAQPSRPTLTSRSEGKSTPESTRPPKSSGRSRVEVVQVPASKPSPRAAAKPASSSGWFVKMLLAFAVAYCVVRYFRDDVTRAVSTPPSNPAPAASR